MAARHTDQPRAKRLPPKKVVHRRDISSARSAAPPVASALSAPKALSVPKAATPTYSFRWTKRATPPAATSSRAARIAARPHGQTRRPHRRGRRARDQPLRRHVLRTGRQGMVQIDGKVFTSPISVGDPGAKGVQPDDKVVIEMVRFPSHVARRRRRDRRGARRPRPAGRRHAVDHSRVRPARRICRRRRSKTPASRPTSSTNRLGDRRRPHGRNDHHDRSGRRPRLRRRDLARAARERPLAARRAHCRRLALRAAEIAARPRSPRPGDERLSARSRDPDAAGDHLEQPGQPAARQGALHQDGVHRVHAEDGIRVAMRRLQERRSRAAAGSPTKRSTNTWPTARRGASKLTPEVHAAARRACTSWR